MACCLIVIYLVGRAGDALARWAIFWGLRPAPPGSRLPTWRGKLVARRRASLPVSGA